jgi:eukaryotic-like serine/threonine-protein kinase
MTTPQLLSDRYELGEIIGFGGMAEVHLARDLRLHRDVAVKVLRADLARDPSFYQRFKREAQNAAALNHPAIVAVHDTGEAETTTGPVPYIVMEYVDGVTLRDIIRTDGPIEPRRAIEIIADAAQALNFSHQHGIIHRDVKPANIMISKTGAVKVMDFGIARAIADAGHSLTQTAAIIGTAQYLSPEQAHGETVDARSDVYSLGCVLYELLTGGPPFIGDTPVAVVYQHVRKAPTPPSARRPGISPELDAIVLKALAKDPKDRYQTAADMRTDLVRVHSGQTPDAPAVPTDAETTESSSPRAGMVHRTEPLPVLLDDDAATRRPIRRWLVVGALLAVLAIVATIGITTLAGRVQVPDVSGQAQDDAVALLLGRGFKPHLDPKPDPTTEPEHVIDTEPGANSSVSAGADITVNVSTGPDERDIPDVTTFSPDDAERTLNEAGFDNITRTTGASTPEQKDRVTKTVPPANSTQSVTTEITIVVGTGPDATMVPDVRGQTIETARQILEASGFTKTLPVQVDSPEPVGQVVGTNPPAGQNVSVADLIQIQQSLANQFVMPDLTNQTWEEVKARLGAMGWTGGLDRGADVPGDDQHRNRVISQSPPAGTPVGFANKVTLNFGS